MLGNKKHTTRKESHHEISSTKTEQGSRIKKTACTAKTATNANKRTTAVQAGLGGSGILGRSGKVWSANTNRAGSTVEAESAANYVCNLHSVCFTNTLRQYAEECTKKDGRVRLDSLSLSSKAESLVTLTANDSALESLTLKYWIHPTYLYQVWYNIYSEDNIRAVQKRSHNMLNTILVAFLYMVGRGSPCGELVLESILNVAYAEHFYTGAVNEEGLKHIAKLNKTKTLEFCSWSMALSKLESAYVSSYPEFNLLVFTAIEDAIAEQLANSTRMFEVFEDGSYKVELITEDVGINFTGCIDNLPCAESVWVPIVD